MRKTICILSLIAVTSLASASDVFAQRRGGGGGRGGYGYGRGYGGYYGGGIGFYYGGPYYYGNGGYSYSTPTYPADPAYYSGPVVQAQPTVPRVSFYPADQGVATIMVRVPNSDAQVWFDEAATSQRGMERTFQTPALQQAGIYTIKARWTQNGRTIDQERQVQVQPGQSVTVNFQANASEGVSAPQPR